MADTGMLSGVSKSYHRCLKDLRQLKAAEAYTAHMSQGVNMRSEVLKIHLYLILNGNCFPKSV